jgi:photosystem II stability/assembly factor-like uncharacterized protein
MSVKPMFLIVCLFFLGINAASAQQKWMELRDKGANFYDIKAAFYEENKSLLKSYYKNLRNEDPPLVRNETNEGYQAEHEKEEYQNLIHYFRWAEVFEPRVSETKGDISALIEADYRARLTQQREQSGLRSAASWSLVGPVNTDNMAGNGRINSIKVDPNNANTFFACSPAGQLWKSTNAGGSWTVISDAIPAAGATDVAIDPTNSNILYALTGDADQAIYHPSSRGCYKSTNGGATWSPTGLIYTSAGVLLTSVIIHPTSPNIVIVSGTNGIWRSTNSGANFTQVSTSSIREVVFNPLKPATVYAGSKSGAVLLRSYDAGVTWTQLGGGLPASSAAVRFSIDISKADTNYVYVMATNSGANMQGFYRSTDAGATFSLMSTTPNIPNGQGWYNLAVAADPAAANTVYAAGLTIYKSIDGGATWASAGGIHSDVHDLQFLGADILAASDGGVYRRSGTSWTNISSNLAIAQPYSIGLSPTNTNTVVSGHQDNGTNITTNGTTWRAFSGGDGMVCFVDRTNANNLYMTYQNGVLRRSTNGGTNTTTLWNVPNGYWVTPYIQDPTTPTTLYAGGFNIYKSINSGTTWDSISNFGTGLQFRWIDVARTNSNIVYATTATAIYKTTDGGLNWTNVSGTVPTTTHLSIHIDVNNSNIVYVTLASTGTSQVFYTNNGGTTWTNISAGLPAVAANCIATQINLAGVAYCGTDLGVYYRDPSVSSTWQPYNAGLPSVPVRDLEIHYPTGQIYAGTFGRSIWVSPLDKVIPVELIEFKGTPNTEGSLLTWQTAQEIRFNHFEVERSSDSKTWQKFTETAAKGSASTYEILDTKPFYGINYYRLKMVDNDATFSYSKIVAIDWNKVSSTKWALFPNPVKDKLFLSGNEDISGEQAVQIMDIAGKIIVQTTIQKLRNGLSINNLANGTYFLELPNAKEAERKSFVVNR